MRMPPQKHIIDSGATSNASTAQTSLLLVKGTINPDPFTNNFECRAGSIIGAMAIQIDIVPEAGQLHSAPTFFDWGIFFNINDSQTAPSMDDVMGSAGADLLNQVIHQDGCLLSQVPVAGTQTAPYNEKSWRLLVKIPRSWSKLGRGDTIRLYFKFSNTNTHWLKIRVIYKEYFP